MTEQKWKSDPTLHSCDRIDEDLQSKKVLDYYDTYINEFLEKDPLRDWESIERCISLWSFMLDKLEKNIINVKNENWSVLDVGTKDGQFPEWLNTQGIDCLGIEISDNYVNYAQKKNRNVKYGDVCNLSSKWENKFDVVFSHHLLGLVPDYWVGLCEMYKVTKPGGYMITLNQVPGNRKKHFSYIDSPDIFGKFTMINKCNIIYNDYVDLGFPNEWVYIIQK